MSDTPDWDSLVGSPVLLTNITSQDDAIIADVHILNSAGSAESYSAATLPAEVAKQAARNANTSRANLGVFNGTELSAASDVVAASARAYLANLIDTQENTTR